MAIKEIQVLRVVPMTGRESYRSCGRAFPRHATDIPLSELTKHEIEKLKKDPNLSATDVTLKVEVPVDDGNGGEAGRPEGDATPSPVKPAARGAGAKG
ncbi:MAG: hypothetical protein VB138_10685 [Burkholderia sp.]